jgi:hypothetical protein
MTAGSQDRAVPAAERRGDVGPDGRYESVRDAIPEPEPLAGSHGTYAKGELSSIGDLIGDITTDLSTLLRQEVALAKAELTESATKAGKGAGLLGGGGVAAHMGLLFLSVALTAALAAWWDSPGWAALAVGLLWLVVGAVLASVGRGQLKNMTGMERTVDSAKRVPDALKGNENRR